MSDRFRLNLIYDTSAIRSNYKLLLFRFT